MAPIGKGAVALGDTQNHQGTAPELNAEPESSALDEICQRCKNPGNWISIVWVFLGFKAPGTSKAIRKRIESKIGENH